MVTIMDIKIKYIKLSQYAKENSIHYKTALRYYHTGIIKGKQLPTGTILVEIEN